MSSTTGIEKIASALTLVADGLRELGYPDRMSVDEVLVPEQCMTITLAGVVYNVSVTKLTDTNDEGGKARGDEDGGSATEQGSGYGAARRASREDAAPPSSLPGT